MSNECETFKENLKKINCHHVKSGSADPLDEETWAFEDEATINLLGHVVTKKDVFLAGIGRF